MADGDLTDVQEALDVASKIKQEVDQSFPEQLGTFVSKLEENIGNFNNVTTRLSGASETLGGMFKQPTEEINKFARSYQEKMSGINKVSVGQNLMSGVSLSVESFNKAKGRLLEGMAALKGEGQGLSKALGTLGIIGGAEIGKKALEDLFGSLLKAQQNLLNLNKSAIQIGTSFGDGFADARASAEMFVDSQAEIQANLYATDEQLGGLRDAFKGALDLTDQMGALNDLSKAQAQFGTTLNATSAAFAVGNAVGMESKDVAAMVAKSYTQLGESLSGAVTNLGTIAIAGEKSGLSFETNAKAIMDATSTLKMFGGTVGAVAPVYRAFSNSLEEGKKGLAPELLEQYASGLNKMNLSQRAFMGMQAGMGGGGAGALGAGLRMEAALETGEGMGEITESLSSVLKDFGGGQILTREEAIDSGMEQQFVQQRQILMNMMQIDQASANQTLGMLQSIDQNGLESISGQEDKLGELLTKGEQTTKESANVATKIDAFKNAALKSADNITNEIRKLSDKMELTPILQGFMETMRGAAIRGGVNVGEDIEKFKSTVGAAKPAEEQARERGVAARGRRRRTRRETAAATGRRQANAANPMRGLFSGFRQAQTSGRGIATSLAQARQNSARIAQSFNNIRIPTITTAPTTRRSEPPDLQPPALPPLPQLPEAPRDAQANQQLAIARDVSNRREQAAQRPRAQQTTDIPLPEKPTLPALPGMQQPDHVAQEQPRTARQVAEENYEQKMSEWMASKKDYKDRLGDVGTQRPNIEKPQVTTEKVADDQVPTDEPKSLVQRLTETIEQGKAGMRARNEARRTGGTEHDMMAAEMKARGQARADSVRPQTAPVAAGVEAATSVRKERAAAEPDTAAATKKITQEVEIDVKIKPGDGTSMDLEPIIKEVNRKQQVESKA